MAFKSEVPLSTINKGMERDSNCYALDAVKIAHALHVPLEYLLDLNEKQQQTEAAPEPGNEKLYYKYRRILTAFDDIPEPQRQLLGELILSFKTSGKAAE